MADNLRWTVRSTCRCRNCRAWLKRPWPLAKDCLLKTASHQRGINVRPSPLLVQPRCHEMNSSSSSIHSEQLGSAHSDQVSGEDGTKVCARGEHSLIVGEDGESPPASVLYSGISLFHIFASSERDHSGYCFFGRFVFTFHD